MAESKTAALLRELVLEGALPEAPADISLADLGEDARRQGLGGLVLDALESGRASWAEPLRQDLLAVRRRTLIRTLGQIALAARTTALLEAHGIRSLPLKGVTIAETVCRVEADRPMSDTDLLALDRWGDALELLCGSGFTLVDRGDHAWALRDPESPLVLELHRSLTSAPGLFPYDFEGLWARRRKGRAQLAFVPSPEDLLLQLALHASFQHGFVLSLVQWLDFRRLLERESIDWDRLQALAAAARAETPLIGALLAAEALVAAPFPPELRPLVTRLPRGLRAWLSARIAVPLGFVSPARQSLGRARWLLLAGRRAALVWRTLVLPETDEDKTHLHSRLAFVACRALRLARTAFRRPHAPPAPRSGPPPAPERIRTTAEPDRQRCSPSR